VVPLLSVADVVDRHVVVLAPEERHGGEGRATSEHGEGGGLTLALGDDPVLHPNALTTVRIGPARDVSGRVDSGHARLQIGAGDHAAIERKAGFFSKLETWAHTDAGNYQIRRERAAVLQRDGLAVDGAGRVLEVEDHAMLLVEGTHEVPHLRT